VPSKNQLDCRFGNEPDNIEQPGYISSQGNALLKKHQLSSASAGLVTSAMSALQQTNKICISHMFSSGGINHPHSQIVIGLEGREKDGPKGFLWDHGGNEDKKDEKPRCKGICGASVQE